MHFIFWLGLCLSCFVLETFSLIHTCSIHAVSLDHLFWLKNHVWQLLSAFQPLSQNISIKDQLPGKKDQYDNYNIYYWRYLFCFYFRRSCYFIYYRVFVFILQKRNFVVAICKNPGNSLNFIEIPGKSWNLNQFFWWEPCSPFFHNILSIKLTF